MKGDILIIGYTTEQSNFITAQLSSPDSILVLFPTRVLLQGGQRLIPAYWHGPSAKPRIFFDGYRFDQIFIADDSRMNIMQKLFPLLPELYAACSLSDIPVEFQISVLNTDTWNSDFIENWLGCNRRANDGYA